MQKVGVGIAAAVVVAGMTAGCGGRSAGPIPTTNTVDVGVPVAVKQVGTFSAADLDNPTSKPLVIESLRILASDPAVTVRLLVQEPLNDTQVGVVSGPPNQNISFVDLPATVPPGEGNAAVVVELTSSTAGFHSVHGVQIDYRQGSHHYRRTWPLTFTLCAGMKTCAGHQ